ncbi:hypothetical protein HXZ91_04835 [Myroides odoratimimus]|uniref:hypothetical protein n=1 Tax=Myroides odoratimimus TaxID=76832 RepID=UPI002577E373|nr:hypothetical protein [Myroides odoratimimus]MDM1033804.1 hypothetical protein [Myroides odoratimimus]
MMKKVLLLIGGMSLLVSCSDYVNKNAIKGADPYDMIMSLEKEGFTKLIMNTDIGTSIQMSNDIGGLKQRYSTFSIDNKSVESVSVSIQVDGVTKYVDAGKSFIQFSATMPYDAMNQEAVSKWVDKNYNNDKKDTIIGDAKFIILAPSKLVRMLTIEKIK